MIAVIFTDPLFLIVLASTMFPGSHLHILAFYIFMIKEEERKKKKPTSPSAPPPTHTHYKKKKKKNWH